MMRSTSMPNALLDTYMPRLRDTEWRVLCVVVRQTIGWSTATGARRTKDWISHAQLKRRTGRSGESVSTAIDSLVRQGLLSVEDSRGRQLRTSTSRKNRFGRIYFSLGPMLETAIQEPSRETRVEKSKATKDSLDKRNLYKKQKEDSTVAAGDRSERGWFRVDGIADQIGAAETSNLGSSAGQEDHE